MVVPVRGQRSPRWAVWRWFHIPDRADPTVTYLSRLRVVQTPWFGIYVHWIRTPDPFDPHDHPWVFWSWIVRGGYLEHRWTRLPSSSNEIARRRRWSMKKTPLSAAHRIAAIEPGTVTVVFVGRRVREWGFYPYRAQWPQLGAFIPWQEYEAV